MRYSDAIKHFGSEVEIAAALACTRQAVALWKEGDVIPKGRAYELQVITGGKLRVDRTLYDGKQVAA